VTQPQISDSLSAVVRADSKADVWGCLVGFSFRAVYSIVANTEVFNIKIQIEYVLHLEFRISYDEI